MIPLILLALGLAMDAFSVSVSFGVCHKDCKPYAALRLALCTGIFQFVMPLIGSFTGNFVGKYISGITKWIAFLLLTIIGLKMIIDAVMKYIKKEKCETVDISKGIKLLLIGITTSIDALVAGFSIGLLGFNIFIAAGLIGTITFVLSFSGVYFGKAVGFILGEWAEIAGGIILIGIGVKALL